MGIVIGQTKDDITGMILEIYWKCQHFCKKSPYAESNKMPEGHETNSLGEHLRILKLNDHKKAQAL